MNNISWLADDFDDTVTVVKEFADKNDITVDQALTIIKILLYSKIYNSVVKWLR